MAFGSRFGEQVCRIAALGQQLWRTAWGHNFGEQRGGTALGSSFGEKLWTAFQTSWQLRAAATLGKSFLQIWGNRFGEPLWAQLCGAAAQGNRFGGSVGCIFEEQRCTAALKNRSFGEQLSGVALETSFGEQV